MNDSIKLKEQITFDELVEKMKSLVFRGLYDKGGKSIEAYKNAKFTLAKIYPQKSVGSVPRLEIDGKDEEVFTPQPTIYKNQTEIIDTVHRFLASEGIELDNLSGAVKYEWSGRDDFHMLPPIIEKHSYDFKDGHFNLEDIKKRFSGKHVSDYKKNLHDLSKGQLNNFFVDEISTLDNLDVFNSNASIMNYGLSLNGEHHFHIICDGAHRVDYVLEKLQKPISVIVVEGQEKPLLPYYAFPVSFRPSIRLSSKNSEKIYSKLERDKIHLLNDFIKKVLHYDWEGIGLEVSKLRSNTDIF